MEVFCFPNKSPISEIFRPRNELFFGTQTKVARTAIRLNTDWAIQMARFYKKNIFFGAFFENSVP